MSSEPKRKLLRLIEYIGTAKDFDNWYKHGLPMIGTAHFGADMTIRSTLITPYPEVVPPEYDPSQRILDHLFEAWKALGMLGLDISLMIGEDSYSREIKAAQQELTDLINQMQEIHKDVYGVYS